VSEGEQRCLREMLVALGMLAQKSGSSFIEEKELLGIAGRDVKKNLLERLQQRRIVVRRGSAFALTHRSLAVRWEALARWIDERRLRERKIYRWGFIAAVAATLLFVIAGLCMADNSLAINKANALAGIASNRLAATLGKRAGPQRAADRMDVLRDAVKAYKTKPTVISYTTLFQVVNTVASERERERTRTAPGTTAASADAQRRSEPAVADVLAYQVTLDGNGKVDKVARVGGASMKPETPEGKLTEVLFSSNRRFFALVFSDTDGPAVFSIYEWPNRAPIWNNRFDCQGAHVARSLRISPAGDFYTYDCPETAPASYMGGITSEAQRRVGGDEFRSDIFAYFDDAA